MRALGLGLALMVFAVVPAAAQTPAAQQVGTQVAAIIQQSGASGARSSAMARDLQDPQGSRQVVLKADEVARQSILSTVVGAIAASPADAGAIVAAAVGAAPSLRNDIIATATRSYPAFAPAIRGAVGSAPPTLTPPLSQRAAPAPTVVGQTQAPQRQPPPPQPTAAEPDDAFDEAPAVAIATPFNDPLEPINRGIFAFNDVLDRFLIAPIARGYGFIVPEPGKQVVRNFFSNLRAPVRFANDVLQFDSSGAAVTGGRFLINTTVGVLGFLDVADVVGLEHHPADFGQTLHRYSVGAGPYIVIPVLGPSTARDGVGIVADTFLDPLTYLLDTYPRIAVAATEGIVKRETLIDTLDELRASSVDYYAALRAAYFQDRAVALAKGNAPPSSAADDAFGAFE